MRKIGVLVTFLVLASLHVNAQQWELLGTRKVDYKLDRDVIPVTYRDGTFTAIKVVVLNGALNMHKCIIHFENGQTQEVPLRYTFRRGSTSRTIDLAGNRRFIEKVVLWYDSKDLRPARATIQVYGRK